MRDQLQLFLAGEGRGPRRRCGEVDTQRREIANFRAAARDAAKREAATVELARSVIRFLHRSQHDPGLKFGETEEAGIL